MKKKLINILCYILCIVSYLMSIWICIVCAEEIHERLSGNYTFFTQNPTLTKNESTLYFIIWIALFIYIFVKSFINIINKRVYKATIYSLILIVLSLSFNYIELLLF